VYQEQVLFQTICGTEISDAVACDGTTSIYFELITIFRVRCARLECRMQSRRLLLCFETKLRKST
jgi:hypothetical protein